MEHLELPVLNSDETKVVSREILEVEPLGDGGITLLHSPAFVWGIAAGDVIDLDPAEPSGFRLRRRAGNVAIVLALNDPADKTSAVASKLIDAIVLLGGVCEGGPPRMIVFTVPVGAGFGPIEATFNAAREALNGASWWYGNVLDRHDRPLGWWE
jgi:hypothetical protein